MPRPNFLCTLFCWKWCQNCFILNIRHFLFLLYCAINTSLEIILFGSAEVSIKSGDSSLKHCFLGGPGSDEDTKHASVDLGHCMQEFPGIIGYHNRILPWAPDKTMFVWCTWEKVGLSVPRWFPNTWISPRDWQLRLLINYSRKHRSSVVLNLMTP